MQTVIFRSRFVLPPSASASAVEHQEADLLRIEPWPADGCTRVGLGKKRLARKQREGYLAFRREALFHPSPACRAASDGSGVLGPPSEFNFLVRALQAPLPGTTTHGMSSNAL